MSRRNDATSGFEGVERNSVNRSGLVKCIFQPTLEDGTSALFPQEQKTIVVRENYSRQSLDWRHRSLNPFARCRPGNSMIVHQPVRHERRKGRTVLRQNGFNGRGSGHGPRGIEHRAPPRMSHYTIYSLSYKHRCAKVESSFA
jgi:hypothetical protein